MKLCTNWQSSESYCCLRGTESTLVNAIGMRGAFVGTHLEEWSLDDLAPQQHATEVGEAVVADHQRTWKEEPEQPTAAAAAAGAPRKQRATVTR